MQHLQLISLAHVAFVLLALLGRKGAAGEVVRLLKSENAGGKPSLTQVEERSSFGGSNFIKDQIRFLLRDRRGQSWRVMKTNGEVPSIWSPNDDLKLIIHGYSSKVIRDSNMEVLRDQNIPDIGLVYGLEDPTRNIVLVDWVKIATQIPSRYEEVVRDVPLVAREVAQFLKTLVNARQIPEYTDVHIIGFSLGAHLAGVVGSIIQKDTIKNIGRITGLDPNGPEYDSPGGGFSKNELAALSKNDADFVDVIHCNMGTPFTFGEAIVKGRYGSTVQAGHADFYPNGGEVQTPYCDRADEGVDRACSHRKCTDFFAKSITQNFTACPCDDWDYYKACRCDCTMKNRGQILGEFCSELAYGRYFLRLTP